MRRLWKRLDATIWTPSLILFAVAVFLERFGRGLLGGARINFFVDTLGLSSGQVLWLEGIRELPGLLLIFVAALTVHRPLARQGALGVALMGVGYGLYAFAPSYSLLLVFSIIAIFGFHLWTPLNSAIGMSLSSKENTGRILGMLSSVASLAAITGMGAISLISSFFESMPLNVYYIVGGAFIVLSAPLFFRLPKHIGSTEVQPARIVLKRRYWLYYVLIFFAGARKLVVNSFVTLVLVQNYGLKVWQISTLILISSALSMLAAPYLGSLVDRLGERVTTPASYVALALSCIGFATIDNVWFLISFWLLNRLMGPLGMGLSTYVYRTAPPEELTPTLAAGVTFDHISSVSMPFLAGALIPVIDYSGIFLGTAGLILLSVPFARALQVRLPAAQPVASGAE